MPDFTPHYLLPYAKDLDYLTNYPAEVSQVLAARVDEALEDLRNTPWAQIERPAGSASFSISSGSWAGLTTYDSASLQATGITYAGGVFTIRRAGVYTLTGNATFSGNTNGRRGLAFLLNGAIIDPEMILGVGGLGSSTQLSAPTRDLKLAVGDTVQMRAFQDSGSTLQLSRTLFTCAYRRDYFA